MTKSSTGTTPLPLSDGTSIRVWFDDANCETQEAQALIASSFELPKRDHNINGSLVQRNRNFIIWVVKNGLLRIVDRKRRGAKGLIREHAKQEITDIQFFNQDDIVATVGGPTAQCAKSSLLVSRVSQVGNAINYDILLEFSTEFFAMSRIIWHPFDVNQLCMIHEDQGGTNVGTHINAQAINCSKSEAGHSVCTFASEFCVKEGAVRIQGKGYLTDIAWSRAAERHMLATYDSGDIVLHDWKKAETISGDPHTAASIVGSIHESEPVTRCLFLPHTHSSERTNGGSIPLTRCFVTATSQNATITLWSPFTSDGASPTKLQVIGLEHPSSSYLLDVCYLPPPFQPVNVLGKTPVSSMIVMADRSAGKIFTWHLQGSKNGEPGGQETPKLILEGCDYVVPFRCKLPTYSWHVQTESTTCEDEDEDDTSSSNPINFDVQMCAFQSTAVQELSLTSMMLLPPSELWTASTPGVRFEKLASEERISVDGELKFDEEYDVEDEEEIENEFDAAPDASALPPPPGIMGGAISSSNNPFSNWLGSLAAGKPSSSLPSSMQVVPKPPPGLLVDTMTPPPAPVDPAIIAASVEPPADPAIISTSVPPVFNDAGASFASTAGTPSILSSLLTPTVQSSAAVPTPQPSTTRNEKTPNRRGKSPKGRDKSPRKSSFLDADTVRAIVREELNASLGPAIDRAVQRSVGKDVIAPLKASILDVSKREITMDESKKIAEAVADCVDLPIRAAFGNAMKTAVLPALQSGMGLVLQQVGDRLDQSFAARDTVVESNKKELGELSSQVLQLTDMVTKLTTELQALKGAISTQQRVASPPVPSNPPKKTPEDIKNSIQQMCGLGKYEEAFNLALTAADYRYTFFCCQNSDIAAVFSGERIRLSPLILLCIMQHLTQVVAVATTDMELATSLQWLQEIALSLNPPAPEIRQHLPRVVDELTRAVNKRISQGDLAHRQRDFYRILQIVRGLQM